MHRRSLALLTVISSLGCTPTTPTTAPQDSSGSSEPSVEPSSTTASSEPTQPATAANDVCPQDPFATWPACETQRVRIHGTNAQLVQQHPLLAAPALDGQPAEHQGYMDVPNVGQIIVLTREPFDCPAAMVATGKLRNIEAKVDKAVKSPATYGGWVLEGATVECDHGTP